MDNDEITLLVAVLGVIVAFLQTIYMRKEREDSALVNQQIESWKYWTQHLHELLQAERKRADKCEEQQGKKPSEDEQRVELYTWEQMQQKVKHMRFRTLGAKQPALGWNAMHIANIALWSALAFWLIYRVFQGRF